MGEFPQFDKGNIPIAKKYAMGYFPHMPKQHQDAFVRGLQVIIEAEGWKMKPVSEAAGMSESGVRDLFRNASSPKVRNAFAIAQAVNRTIDDIIEIGLTGVIPPKNALPSIAVPGRVGAGDEVMLTDDHAKGNGLYHVECPPQLSPRGIVAVEVKGTSMEPAFYEGDLLFYTRITAEGVPSEAIGRRVIAETDDGRVWVKQIKIGTEMGLFHLLSLNPTGANMLNVSVKWAAPIKLHLPKEFVRRAG